MTEHRQRVAIVTGAGSPHGIGFAAARRLGERGARVVITSTTDRIFDRVAELRAGGAEAVGYVADLTEPSAAHAVVAHASQSFDGLDILVNNAGMTSVSSSYASGGIDQLSLDAWRASLERNLTTSFLMTRAVVARMQAAGYGRIVNVSSVSGPVAAYAGDVGYHAAKAGLVGLTRAAAIDLAGEGITVNAVAPGWDRHLVRIQRRAALGCRHTRRAVRDRRRGGAHHRVPGRRGRVVHHRSADHGRRGELRQRSARLSPTFSRPTTSRRRRQP